MRTIDVIAQILKQEGVDFLSAFPTTPVIEAAAEVGIRPVICRQERAGVGIADGFSRVKNGKPPGVFAMQYGPGAENAFAGVATAFSDASPVLLLPLGHPRDRDGIYPFFSSVRTFSSVTKSVEQMNSPDRVVDTMRRAFAHLKRGRPGPVMVEIPIDVAVGEVDSSILERYRPVKPSISQGDPRDVLAAANALIQAKNPIILAGQGVLYAEASDELIELAELLQIPVMTSMEGKSAIPEKHPLALGSAAVVMSGPVYHFLGKADIVFAIGTSLTAHGMAPKVPQGKMIVHATNDSIDVDKDHIVDFPIIGDAKLVLRQFIEACQELLGAKKRTPETSLAMEINQVRQDWLAEWMPTLTSDETPITPYRVIWEFMQNIDPNEAIVTHDSGSPRDQITPFYQAGGPRTYLGWGKSHALGTGLGLAIGAKLADPDKFSVNFMGDAAFGMIGLDFETAVRSNAPICTIVLNNYTMAVETQSMDLSQRLYGSRDLGGNFSEMALAMGGWAERVEDPSQVGPAILRAKKATQEGKAALLEFITSHALARSHQGAFR